MATPTDSQTWTAILKVASLLLGGIGKGIGQGLWSFAIGNVILLVSLATALLLALIADVGPIAVGTRGTRTIRRKVEHAAGTLIVGFVVVELVARHLGH